MDRMDTYTRWKQNSSKGEVFTPKTLVNEMLDKIPVEVWENPKSTFCDLSMGKGTFLVEIVNRLTYTYKYSEEDAKSRAFGYEIRAKYVNYLTRRRYKNLYHTDSLKEQIDMKFDVVIGNPPYQDGNRKDESNKIYPLFIIKSLDILKDGGYLSMITPTSWFTSTADIGKGNSGISILNEFKKLNLIYLNPNSDDIKREYFNGVGSTFCYFLVKNDNNYSNTKMGGRDIDITNFDNLPKIQNELSFSILSKFGLHSENLDKFVWIDQNHNLLDEESKTKRDDLTYINYHTPAKNITYVYSPNKHKHQDENKIILSLSGKYKPYYDKGLLGFSNMCLALTSANGDLESVYGILTSKLYRFMVENNKFSGFNPRKYILNLPKLNTEKRWSDYEIYQYFNLTEKEITFIENIIK